MTTNKFNPTRRAFVAGAGAAATLTGLNVRGMALAATGGTFTFGRPRETSHLDPHGSQLSTSWHIQHMVFDSLVTLDEDYKVAPSLAESWEWDGNTLIFKIRDGVKFANGRDMTMEDVNASLDRALSTGGNPWGLMLRNLKERKIMDGNRLAFVFDGPNNVALDSLSATLVCIMPMKEIEDGSYDPEGDMYMGTGPYYVEAHVNNDRWVLKANPHYWGGVAKTETVVVRTIPSVQGLVSALRDGSIDAAMFNFDPDAPALLAGIPNLSTASMATTDYNYVALNALKEDSPFTDLRVRQAVALALDRDQIINFALAGVPAKTYGWTQWGLTDDSKLPLYERNLERAKELMAEANPSNTTVNYLIRGGAVNERIAQVVAQQLAEIGITCELENVDGGIWAKRVWATDPSDFDITNSSYTGFAHPLVTAHWWASEIVGFTDGYVPSSEEYTAALNDATLVASSQDEVNASLQGLYNMLNEQAVKIPVNVNTYTVAWRDDKVSMTPSRQQSQNDVLAYVETFEMKS